MIELGREKRQSIGTMCKASSEVLVRGAAEGTMGRVCLTMEIFKFVLRLIYLCCVFLLDLELSQCASELFDIGGQSFYNIA